MNATASRHGETAMRLTSALAPALMLAPMLALAPGLALAHPHHQGGSALGASLAHLLSEPDHLAALLLPVVVAAIWIWRSRARAARKSRERHTPND